MNEACFDSLTTEVGNPYSVLQISLSVSPLRSITCLSANACRYGDCGKSSPSENSILFWYGWNDNASKYPSAPFLYMSSTKSTGLMVRSPALMPAPTTPPTTRAGGAAAWFGVVAAWSKVSYRAGLVDGIQT